MKTVKYRLGEAYGTRGCVLALGFFDGVHLGHRSLISSAAQEAKRLGVPSAVLTFAYGGGLKKDSAMIYSEKERELLLSAARIDICFVADFSELRALSPVDFVNRSVISDIGAAVAVAGYDYRFGYKGAGDAELLAELMELSGRRARISDAYMYGGEPVSSTRVRTSLENGDMEAANKMLGVPYFISGTVEHGRGDGRRFGFPTVNLSVSEDRARLMRGVYLTAVKIGEKLYTGLTNVGECPTFGSRKYHAETYISDFSGDIYGQDVRVYFLSFIRKERVFSSAEELSRQIEKDCAAAREIKEKIKWQEIGLV